MIHLTSLYRMQSSQWLHGKPALSQDQPIRVLAENGVLSVPFRNWNIPVEGRYRTDMHDMQDARQDKLQTGFALQVRRQQPTTTVLLIVQQ